MSVARNHWFSIIAFALGLVTGVAWISHRNAPNVPPVPTAWATDTVGALNPIVLERLDARLEGFQRRTGHHVLLYVTDSTKGEAHYDWTVRCFNSWGIGREGYDDGIVLFIFTEDNMRRIAVGYGLEEKLSDADATQIIRDVIRPLTDHRHFNEAASEGIDAILAKVQ